MTESQIVTLFLKGGEESWLRAMSLLGVELYNQRFTGNAIRQLPFGKGLRTVEISNRTYKESRLRGITVFDDVGGYIVNVVEPSPGKSLVRVYVKKQLFDEDLNVKYWQEVFHRLYNPKTREWSLLLNVEDERPSLRK